jgi:hypothetical protein
VSVDDRELFVTHVLHGRRFENHAVPIDLFTDIAAYRQLVVAVARALFFQRNQGRQRVSRGFLDSFQLVVSQITDPGCAAVPLERLAHPKSAQLSFESDVFDEARDLLATTIDAVSHGRTPPVEFPLELAHLFNGFGASLRSDERIEMLAPGKSAAVSYDRAARKHLILLRESAFEDVCDVTGTVVVLNREKMSFELALDPGTVPGPLEHRTVPGLLTQLGDEALAVIFTAASSSPEPLRVRVVGRGAFDRADRLLRFVDIDDVNYADDEHLKDALDVERRLSSFASLTPGWLDGDGEAIDAQGLDWLSSILAVVVEDGLRPYLYPTPDGHVLAEWSFSDTEVSAEFDLVDHTAEVVGTHVRSHAMADTTIDFGRDGAIDSLRDFVRSFGPAGAGRA